MSQHFIKVSLTYSKKRMTTTMTTMMTKRVTITPTTGPTTSLLLSSSDTGDSTSVIPVTVNIEAMVYNYIIDVSIVSIRYMRSSLDIIELLSFLLAEIISIGLQFLYSL